LKPAWKKAGVAGMVPASSSASCACGGARSGPETLSSALDRA